METETERDRQPDDSELRRGATEPRRGSRLPSEETDTARRSSDQRKAEKAEKAAREAVKLKEQNVQLRKLKLDRQIAQSKDDRREIARLDSQIVAVDEEREKIAGKVAEELEAGFLIRDLEDLTSRLREGRTEGADPETLVLFEEAWLNQEKAAIAAQANYRPIVEAVDGLISRRRASLAGEREIAGEGRGLGPLVESLKESDFMRELRDLIKDLPDEEKAFLTRYYGREVEKNLAVQVAQAEWGSKSLKEQTDWLNGMIIDLRNLSLDPSMLLYSPLWQELIQRLSSRETHPSLRDKFLAHLNVLKFNLGVRKLKDANLDIRDLTRGLEILDKSSLKELFKSEEIQIAYDLLEKSGRTLKVTSLSALESLLMTDEREERSLVAQYLDKRGISIRKDELDHPEEIEEAARRKEVEEAVREARCALYEAFDLYYFFGSFQAIEHSDMRPDSVSKVLNVTGWMEGKFRPPFVEVYGRERFYHKEHGKFVTVVGDKKDEANWAKRARERQMVGLGNNKPLHQLFSSPGLSVRDLEDMGFIRNGGEEEGREIYDYRHRRCFCFDPDSKEGRGVKGTILYKKGDEEIEVIVKPPTPGKRPEKIVAVRVANIKAETLGKVFSLDSIGENWIGGYCKFNLGYAENTRRTALENWLWSAPVGSAEGEWKDPVARLSKAVGSGEFLQNMAWRNIDRGVQPYEIAGEDMNELYLKAVLEWSRSYGKDNDAYRIGGDSLRSQLINESVKKDLIEESGDKRLTDEFFGDYLRRYLKRTISSWPLVVAMRYPGMGGHMIGALWEAIKNFFSSYVFEGTPMEGAGGKPKPKR